MLKTLAAVGGLLAFSVNFIMAVFVLFKNFHTKVNKWFVAFNFCIGFWCLATFLINVIPDYSLALIICRICYGFGVLLVPSFVYLVYALRRKEGSKKARWLLFCTTFILLVFLPTPLFVKGLVTIQGTGVVQPSAGPIYYLFILHVTIGVLSCLYMLFNAIRSSTGILKNQMKFILIAYAIEYLGGMVYFSSILRLISIPLHATYLVTLGCLVLFYAIIKHRLMDIRIIVRVSTVVTFIAVFFTGMYFIGIRLVENILGKLFYENMFYVKTVVIAIVLCTVLIFYKTITKIISSFLLSREKEVKDQLDELSTYLSTALDIKELLELLVDELEFSIRVRCISILIYDDLDKDYKIKTSLGYEDEVMHLEIKDDNPVIDQLKSMRKPIVRDWLNEDKKDVIDYLDKLYAEVCVPMIYDDELVGALCFGKRKRRKYTADEIDILMDFAQKIAIALKNAIKHHRLERKYRVTSDFLEICGGKGLIPKDEEET